MVKVALTLLAFAALVVIGTQSLHARLDPIDTESVQSPVVLELFTSQSCSSCPPADRILTETTKNPNVIALGFHVTYWDHLHWKDTLSREFATDRQRSYARFKNTGRVYTPQMIVNGGEEFTGSNAGKLNKSVQRAHKIQPITITKNDDTLNITLPNSVTDQSQTLWLFGIKDKHTQKIPSGENRGREVSYVNSVLSEKALETWNGEATTIETTIPNNQDINGYIVLAQPGGHAPITAAGQVKF